MSISYPNIKKVNVYATMPVYGIKNPILGNALGIELSVGDIAQCIYRRARVEEIIGKKTLPLTLANYDKDNTKKEEVKVEEPIKKEEAKVEEPVVENEEKQSTPIKNTIKIERKVEQGATQIKK